MRIYHPPPSNNTANATFIDKITELLIDRIAKYNNMVILGVLNIHVDDLTNTESYIFNDTMHAFGFTHVTSPTHKCSHTLDLIFSEMNLELNLHNCIVHGFISDHALVTIDTTLNKAPWEPTENIIRDTTRLTKEILEKYYTTPVIETNASLEQACDQFNEELNKMLNRAAPQKRYATWAGQKTVVQQVYPQTEKIVKKRDHMYKKMQEIITGGPTPLKETCTTDY